MAVLDIRKQEILRLIVEEYVSTATPVASDAIVKKHGLMVSPATVRNEVALLEQEGYISRPHTSAGSVPVDKAYRFYVERLSQIDEPEAAVRADIRRRMRHFQVNLDQWSRLAAHILAHTVQNLAIVTLPKATEVRLKRLQLVYMREFLALLVIVLQQASLKQIILHTEESLPQDDLDRVSNRLTEHYQGLTSHEITALDVELSSVEKQVTKATVNSLLSEERTKEDELYQDGLLHLLDQPEFSDAHKARGTVALVEHREVARAALAERAQDPSIQITIGREHSKDVLYPFSVIIASYGVPGKLSGSLVVVGPTRMQYPAVLGAISYLSSLMSEQVTSIQ